MNSILFENHLQNTNTNYSNKKPFILKLFKVLFYVSFFVFLIVTVFNLIFLKAQVIGISMMPTYNKNLDAIHPESAEFYESSPYKDVVFANIFNKGTNGDIILLKLNDELVIKRIIATGGQKVALKKGNGTNDFSNYYYYINDVLLNEDYIYSRDHMDEEYFERFYSGKTNPLDSYKRNFDVTINLFENEAYFVVPENHIFVLGDNRYASADSIIFGTAPTSNIYGKVAFSHEYNQNFLSFLWQKVCSIF